MKRSAIPLAIAAALVLAACGSSPTKTSSRAATPTAGPTPQTLPYQTGNGVVQSITVAPRPASAGASGAPVTTTRGEPVTSAGSTTGAAAGTTAAAGTMHRLAIRMDDGRTQYVDMAGPDIPAVGTRVQLTPDYKIIRQQ